MAIQAIWNRWTRTALGMAISIGFVAVTLAGIDFELLGRAWATVALSMILVAAVLSAAEVAVRAWRWRTLVAPLAQPTYASAYGLLCIGHMANAFLPARLGDVARAVMAGSRWGVSRVSVLGTVAVERVADAGLLAAAATIGIMFGYRGLDNALLLLLVGGVLLCAAVAGGVVLARRHWVLPTRIGAVVVEQGRLLASGASSLRSPVQAAKIAGLTLASFALAVLILEVSASSVGLSMALWQSAAVIAVVTLSTAIPAGPASLGTYEFVGVSVMTSMGFPAEESLLAIALVHAVATFTPAVIGLVALWSMGLNPVKTRFGTRAELVAERGMGRGA